MVQQKHATVVALVSGKGGAGKTSIGLSIAALLSKIEFSVLFIDFDLATNGASYFFRAQLSQQGALGMWDLFAMDDKVTMGEESRRDMYKRVIVKLSDGFDFIASRTKFDARPIDIRSVTEEREVDVLSGILKDRDLLSRYDYVIVDCQAGYSTPADIALTHSDKAVIVSELDAISNDAAEMLIAQAGTKIPEFRRFLLNKLMIDEMDQYEQVAPIFRALNRLPAIPHDFDVRSAFGDRRIPVDMEKPSPYLFSMFRVLSELFPEAQDRIRELESSQVNELIGDYEHNIDRLAERRAHLIHALDLVSERQGRYNRRLVTFATIWAAEILAALAVLSVFVDLGRYALPILLSLLTIASVAAAYLYNRISRQRWVNTDERFALQRELEYINRELERFQSLVYSKSKEFRMRFPRTPTMEKVEEEEPKQPTEGVYYNCKICGEYHLSPIAFGDRRSFESSTLSGNVFHCPNTGDQATYDKSDMFWIGKG